LPEEHRAEIWSLPVRDSNQVGNEQRILQEKPFGSGYYQLNSASHGRRYVIAALATVVVAVSYVGWPFLRSRVQSILQPSPAVQAPVTRSRSSQPGAPMSIEAKQSGREENQPQAGSPPRPVPLEPEETVARKANSGEHSTQPAGPMTAGSRSEAPDLALDGTQELLQAQRYLDGRGVARDSGQAAALLWQAVSKQNTRADLMLADLYLRGDGVGKSCDQARLLLVAAAKKGAAEAAEKLRNIESSGCQ